MSTRIIESPRERMLAILTNNFVPCNGRWPMLILMASLFMVAGYTGSMQTLVTAGVVVGMVVIGVIMTLTVSWVLSKTALKGFRPTTHLSYLRTASQKFGIQLFAQHSISQSMF